MTKRSPRTGRVFEGLSRVLVSEGVQAAVWFVYREQIIIVGVRRVRAVEGDGKRRIATSGLAVKEATGTVFAGGSKGRMCTRSLAVAPAESVTVTENRYAM